MRATLPPQFGRYRILRQLGEGGMGTVYLAEDTRLRRQVALKVPNFESNENPAVLERFYREARMAAQIQHPNLCPVYDVDCYNQTHFLTMAYIEGTPLSHYVGPGRLWPVTSALQVVMQLALGLQQLHDQKIIHRDLKPSNVILRPNGIPVLMDFGLARTFETASERLTGESQVLGTPAYMAPEQVTGNPDAIGPWTDVYALGAFLYQLLTGHLPFDAPTLPELYARILYAAPPSPALLRPGLDPRLDALCVQALAKDPAHRPPSMSAFARMLQNCLVQQTPPADSHGVTLPGPGTAAQPHDPTLAHNTTTPTHLPTPPPPLLEIPSPRRWPMVFGIVGACLVILIGTIWTVMLVLHNEEPTAVASGATGSTTPSGITGPTKTTGTTKPVEPGHPELLLSAQRDLTLKAGAAQTLRVEIERRNCTGPVRVGVVGSITGVQVTATTITEGQTSGELRLTAESDAPGTRELVRIIARGPENTVAEQPLRVVVESPPISKFTWSYGLALRARKAGQQTFDDTTPNHGVEIFWDPVTTHLMYVSRPGALSLGVGTPLRRSEKVRIPLYNHGLELTVREVGETKFKDGKIKKFGCEVYNDVNTDNLVYISDPGYVAVIRRNGLNKPEKPLNPTWYHGLELRVRRAGEKTATDTTPKIAMEVYKDENTNHLIYMTDKGALALLPATGLSKPTAIKNPTWMYAFEVKARPPEEENFTDSTRKYGVEVYKDENTGALIYVCETGDIAVFPGAGISKPNPFQSLKFLAGRLCRVRIPGETEFSAKTQRYGIEVYTDPNSNLKLYICNNGAVAVCR